MWAIEWSRDRWSRDVIGHGHWGHEFRDPNEIVA